MGSGSSIIEVRRTDQVDRQSDQASRQSDRAPRRSDQDSRRPAKAARRSARDARHSAQIAREAAQVAQQAAQTAVQPGQIANVGPPFNVLPALRDALEYIADYLESKHEELTIITLGELVNDRGLYFFGTNVDGDEHVLLEEAAKRAVDWNPEQLGHDWFNNQTALWVSSNATNAYEELTQLALDRNEIVFRRKGLRVVLATWYSWAEGFLTKVDRISRGVEQEYDLPDAASYLKMYLDCQSPQQVHIEWVRSCARYWNLGFDQNTLNMVNQEYRRRYGRDGLVHRLING